MTSAQPLDLDGAVAQRDPDHLITSNLPLAYHFASHFMGRGETFEDLLQVASLALTKAAHRFDPDINPRFSTYASHVIRGGLRRHLRDKVWGIRPPRRVQELFLQLVPARSELTQSLGRTPSQAELADYLDVPYDALDRVSAADRTYRLASLEALESSMGGESPSCTGQIDPEIESLDVRVDLEDLTSRLTERERMILHLRYVVDLTQRDIAQRMGISQMHVSRLLQTALDTLRGYLDVSDPPRRS